MKFLHIIRSVNPAGGGVIEGVVQLSKIHTNLGHSVEILTLDAPDDEWVRSCPFPSHAVGPASGTYGYSPRMAPWLQEHSAQYDSVIVHGLWQYHGLCARNVLRRQRKPYFVFPHGMLDPWFKRTYPLKHLKKWIYWPWGEYRVLRDAKQVLFTCDEERILARQSFWLYRCNERVVNFGTTRPTGDPDQQRNAFLQAYPVLQHRRILLFLSRVHEKKGLELLIQAFGNLFNGSRHFSNGAPLPCLAIAGPCAEANYLESLKQLAAKCCPPDSVYWLGPVYGDIKWGAFHASEAFALSSHQENFGVAIVEALACELPVLISNKVNIWREIQEAGAGLVSEDDQPGVNAMLDQWYSLDDSARKDFRARAVAAFNRHFDMANTAQKLVEISTLTA